MQAIKQRCAEIIRQRKEQLKLRDIPDDDEQRPRQASPTEDKVLRNPFLNEDSEPQLDAESPEEIDMLQRIKETSHKQALLDCKNSFAYASGQSLGDNGGLADYFNHQLSEDLPSKRVEEVLNRSGFACHDRVPEKPTESTRSLAQYAAAENTASLHGFSQRETFAPQVVRNDERRKQLLERLTFNETVKNEECYQRAPSFIDNESDRPQIESRHR